jgi:cellulose synthase/poly-beta-1,6-N-acetylglucosamine synthase-like glycosyltransferase
LDKQLGTVLVEEGLISKIQLDEALTIQKRTGGRLGWVLATLGYIRRDDLFRALSKHYGLKYVSPELPEIARTFDKEVLNRASREVLLKWQALPYRIREGTLILLNSYPGNTESLAYFKMLFGVTSVEEWVVTDLDVLNLVKQLFHESLLESAVYGLFFRNREESAYKVFTFRQFSLIIATVILFAALVAIAPLPTLRCVLLLLQILYVVLIGFKFVLSLYGTVDEITYHEKPDEYRDLKDDQLPVYTVLVPVFREPEVVGTLIEGLKKLDYPANKLDIILLLEEVDTATLDAAKKAKPPANWRFLIVPKSKPQTKPKACNYGLLFARGTYLVIFDAEDIPQPDQLKKAVLAFEQSDPSYICFQGALNYFNKNQNLLTKLFTLEYSFWFDYMLPGLFNLRLPIPLGGTSNHFRVADLKRIGGWDPFNTTEDADLGIRAAAEKYKVGIIRSTTYEEATSGTWNWIRQRSRWIKGYMQTTLVYNRHPLKLIRAIGFRQWFSFQLFIGGTPVLFLINPILWILFLVWIAWNPLWLSELFTPFLLFLSLFNFLIGNFLGIYLNLLGAFRRKYFGLTIVSLLNPFYWLLHSFSSYKALWQLLRNPHFWEKTHHGFTSNSAHREGKL